MGAMAYPLEPGPEQMRAMGEAALGYLIEFVQSQDEAAASDVEGALEAARSVRTAPPAGPGSFSVPSLDPSFRTQNVKPGAAARRTGIHSSITRGRQCSSL